MSLVNEIRLRQAEDQRDQSDQGDSVSLIQGPSFLLSSPDNPNRSDRNSYLHTCFSVDSVLCRYIPPTITKSRRFSETSSHTKILLSCLCSHSRHSGANPEIFPASWPEKGETKSTNVELAYWELAYWPGLPLVLKETIF